MVKGLFLGSMFAVAAGAVAVVGPVASVSAAPAPVPVTVYSSIDDPMPGNVPSVAFQATQTREFGDVITLAPGSRQLQSATIMLSSWGCQSGGNASCLTTPGATFSHPLTLSLYNSTPTGIGSKIFSTTKTFNIPFRPSADPACGVGASQWMGSNGVCYNGFATPVTFDFPTLPIVPDSLVWTMSYNTTTYGTTPIGSPCLPNTNCAYDSLNVGLSAQPQPSVGTDVDPSAVVIKSTYAPNICGTGVSGTLSVSSGCWTNKRPMATFKTAAEPSGTSTEVVRTADTTWAFLNDNAPASPASGQYVFAPALDPAPAGAGSAQLSVTGPTDGQLLGKLMHAGLPLSRINELTYSSNQPGGNAFAPALQFAVSYDGSGAWQGRLVFEPSSLASPVAGGWHDWNALNGKWFASGAPGNATCKQTNLCTWQQVLNAFPSATINPDPALGGFLFKAGSNWATPFTGQVDKFTLGITGLGGNPGSTTTYDFEPTVQCTTTCFVDAATGNDLNGGSTADQAKKTIQAAVTQVSPNGTVNVAAGTYVEDVTIPKTLTLQGAGIDQSTVSGVAGGSHATIFVQAPSVVIDGFTVTRQATAATWQGPLNTAGVSVAGQANDVEIRKSRFVQNRTAIDINDSNDNKIIDNIIQDNRTGIILWNQTDRTVASGNVIADNWTLGVLFIDGGGAVQSSNGSTFRNNAITGNWYGGVVDRQTGGSLPAPGTTNLKNFSGNWWGTTKPDVAVVDSTEPPYTAQIPVALGGTATKPATATSDILGLASANIDYTPMLESGDTQPTVVGFQGSTAALTVTRAGAQTGTASRIQEGVTAVDAAGAVHVRAGIYTEPVPVTISKPLSLLGPNAGISPNDPTTPLKANTARVAQATIAPAGGQVAINVASGSVTIDGLRFTDPGTAGASNVAIIGGLGGDANNLVVTNNVFDEISRIAVYTNGPTLMSGATVTNNRVSNPTRADNCDVAANVAKSSCGRQLFNLWRMDKATFSDNVVFAPAGNGDRVRVFQANFVSTPSAQTDSPADNLVIANNTIRNSCVFSCFTLATGVTNVSITGNDVQVDVGDIVQMHPVWTGGRVQIDHNRFAAAAGSAVIVEGVGGTSAADITVTRNSITGGGVNNKLTTGSVSAPCNWWGQATGPIPAQLSGAVNVSDPLASSDLDAVCPIPLVTPSGPTPTVPPVTPPTVPTVPTGPTAPLATPASGFVPVTPTRVIDTRTGAGVVPVTVQQVGPSNPLEVKFTDLPGGLVPASGVAAVSINVTSTRSTTAGYITASPCGSTNEVSNVNFQAGRDRANAVLAPLSAAGSVCFTSSVPTDIVVDLNGWFTTASGFHPVVPTRAFDTREGTTALRDVAKAKVAPGTRLEVAITDLPGGLVPATGVGSVSLNVTSTRSEGDGYLTVSPCGTDNVVSNLNFQAGDDAANLVLTSVSPTGTICVTSSVATDVVVDVNGWFEPAGFTAVSPTRVLDTRPGTPAALREVAKVKVGPASPLEVKLSDLPGGVVPASGVGAVSINVTSTGSTGDGFLTVSPCGSTNVVSNVNFQRGFDRANAVLTPLSATGTVCITASQPTDVVVDVNGWFSSVTG